MLDVELLWIVSKLGTVSREQKNCIALPSGKLEQPVGTQSSGNNQLYNIIIFEMRQHPASYRSFQVTICKRVRLGVLQREY